MQVQAKSSRILDFIWKMRDTITSTFDAKALSPGHFTFSQRENAKVIDTEARLDPATKRWAVSRQQVGQEPQVYEFESENTLDPITAVYLARSMKRVAKRPRWTPLRCLLSEELGLAPMRDWRTALAAYAEPTSEVLE